MLSFHVNFMQTDRWTDRQTDNGKAICPRSFGEQEQMMIS